MDTDDDGVSGDEGSSRRKSKVVHKVMDTDDDVDVSGDEDDEETPFKTYKNSNGVNGEENEGKYDDKGKDEEKKDDDTIDVDEEGNPILPEGIIYLFIFFFFLTSKFQVFRWIPMLFLISISRSQLPFILPPHLLFLFLSSNNNSNNLFNVCVHVSHRSYNSSNTFIIRTYIRKDNLKP